MAKRTRAKRRGGASRGSDAGPGIVTDPQAPDGSRCAIGQDTTGRQETARPGGSNLLRHPKGSNGDVHRGPDLTIRRNVMEGLMMRALIREGAQLVITATGRRRHRSKIPMAMAENLVTRLQNIVLHGSDQDVLRLVAVANDIFKPGKHDKNGSNGGPFPASFLRPAPSEPAPAETPIQAPAPAPGTLIDANGQEYVAG